VSELHLDAETVDALAEQVATRIANHHQPPVEAPNTRLLLSIPVVAERLGCSTAVVRSYVRRGELIAHSVAGRWQVRESDVEAFLERHRVPGEPPQPASSVRRAPHRGRLAAALDREQ
jgi:excisionase family DNA binding protein